MKKTFIILAACSVMFGACKKADNNSSNGSKTSTLTSGKWKIISSSAVIEYPSPIGNQTVDVYATQPPCAQDNLYTYNSDKTTTTDERPTKCSSGDPQTKSSGTWSLTNGDTHLIVSDNGTSIDATITAFSNSAMTLVYKTYYNSLTATTTTSYSHQ